MAELISIAIWTLAVGLCVLIGGVTYAVLGAFGIIYLMSKKTKKSEPQEVIAFALYKLIAIGSVIGFSVKYGWLGPLIGAIVSAIKAA